MAVFFNPLLIAFPILLLRLDGLRGEGVSDLDLGFVFIAVVDSGATTTASADPGDGPGARARAGATGATGAAAGGWCNGGPSHGSQSRHWYETLKVASEPS
ncbi:hypothetical protein GX51_04130 [Blastomyces parvus]|uniref:Uncharacterized protein n=1 Tax=Blastomyces parvus TaxID=2060905 RepID=A0A2B7X3E1_9EURO|nr:hypothetical protein GX51_04130 [Blastomyces parvus]